jgi:ketosteroid isomerase-like protein
MEHPNARRFRAAFAGIWERGDMQVIDELVRDDVEWINDIGAGPFRQLDGKPAVYSMFDQWMALFDGGFRHELIDVCASDRNVVEVIHEIGTAKGHVFDNLALYHHELDDHGRVFRVRTYDRDRDAIERFWRLVQFEPVMHHGPDGLL